MLQFQLIHEIKCRRLSPSKCRRRKGSSEDFYMPSEEDEENVEPSEQKNLGRYSPSPGIKSELHTKMIVSPYGTSMETGSETESPEEASTSIIYAADPQPLSGTLYYKHEISEPGEFVDVVSWWEQEQSKNPHHTQSHVQRLTHV